MRSIGITRTGATLDEEGISEVGLGMVQRRESCDGGEPASGRSSEVTLCTITRRSNFLTLRRRRTMREEASTGEYAGVHSVVHGSTLDTSEEGMKNSFPVGMLPALPSYSAGRCCRLTLVLYSVDLPARLDALLQLICLAPPSVLPTPSAGRLPDATAGRTPAPLPDVLPVGSAEHVCAVPLPLRLPDTTARTYGGGFFRSLCRHALLVHPLFRVFW
ncbi:hypothetical protein Dimus_024672 [Dionaea muscipula]